MGFHYVLFDVDRLFVCFPGFHYFLNVCPHEYRSCEQSFISLLFLPIFPVATFCWVSCTFWEWMDSVDGLEVYCLDQI